MKKDNTYVYGIIAYIGLVLGMLLSALWAFSAAHAAAAGVGTVICAAVSLYAIVKGMRAEQKLMENKR